MARPDMRGFELDARLHTDSEPLQWLSLCELRIMNDKRWPWLILVPQRRDVYELHDLTPLDQTMVTFETNLVAEALKHATQCQKINTAALGNVVRQLHIHVVARSPGDPGWPGPIWGFGEKEPYHRSDMHRLIERIRGAL